MTPLPGIQTFLTPVKDKPSTFKVDDDEYQPFTEEEFTLSTQPFEELYSQDTFFSMFVSSASTDSTIKQNVDSKKRKGEAKSNGDVSTQKSVKVERDRESGEKKNNLFL